MDEQGFRSLAERTLGGVGLFRGVSEDLMLEMGRRARWRSFPVGHALLRFGDCTNILYNVVRGSIRVSFRDGRGSEDGEAGATVGLRTAFRSEPSDAQVIAATPIEVAELRRVDLLDAMTRSTALVVNVGQILAARSIYEDPRELLDARVLAALARAAETPSGKGLVPLADRIDFALWAALLGVDAVDVKRSFRRIERAGILTWRSSGRALIDVERLRQRLG